MIHTEKEEEIKGLVKHHVEVDIETHMYQTRASLLHNQVPKLLAEIESITEKNQSTRKGVEANHNDVERLAEILAHLSKELLSNESESIKLHHFSHFYRQEITKLNEMSIEVNNRIENQLKEAEEVYNERCMMYNEIQNKISNKQDRLKDAIRKINEQKLEILEKEYEVEVLDKKLTSLEKYKDVERKIQRLELEVDQKTNQYLESQKVFIEQQIRGMSHQIKLDFLNGKI